MIWLQTTGDMLDTHHSQALPHTSLLMPRHDKLCDNSIEPSSSLVVSLSDGVRFVDRLTLDVIIRHCLLYCIESFIAALGSFQDSADVILPNKVLDITALWVNRLLTMMIGPRFSDFIRNVLVST